MGSNGFVLSEFIVGERDGTTLGSNLLYDSIRDKMSCSSEFSSESGVVKDGRVAGNGAQ